MMTRQIRGPIRGMKMADGRRERQRYERAGRTAEWLAMLYLIVTGHRILARRWLGRSGEIDLVARSRRRLLFCEVKYRRDIADSGVPTARQRRRICLAAQEFAARLRVSAACEWRFDLIRVSLPGRGGLTPIYHLKDAWRCDG